MHKTVLTQSAVVFDTKKIFIQTNHGIVTIISMAFIFQINLNKLHINNYEQYTSITVQVLNYLSAIMKLITEIKKW